MRALWFAPPAVFIAGAGGIVLQLRRIAVERLLVAGAVADLESDRARLDQLRRASEEVRAALGRLEHR